MVSEVKEEVDSPGLIVDLDVASPGLVEAASEVASEVVSVVWEAATSKTSSEAVVSETSVVVVSPHRSRVSPVEDQAQLQ